MDEISSAQESPPFQNAYSDQSTAVLIQDSILYSTSSLMQKDIKDLLENAKTRAGSFQMDHARSEEFENAYPMQVPSSVREDVQPILAPVRNLEASKETGAQQGASPLDHDPAFQMLFNKTRVLLERSHFSSDFLTILRRYVGLLLEDGHDAMKDRYVLALQRELDLRDWDVTSPFIDLLDIFLSRPANPWMMLANVERRKQRALLESAFTKWKLKTRVDRYLMKLSYYWGCYVQRKYLQLWQERKNFKTHNLRVEADCLMDFKSQSNNFDKWMKRTDAHKLKQDLANAFFLQKFLKLFIKKGFSSMDSLNLAKQALRKSCLRHTFTSWKLQKRLRLSKELLTRWPKTVSFGRLKTKNKNVASLKQKQLLFEKSHLIGRTLQTWKLRLRENQSKMNELLELEVAFKEKMALKVVKDVIDWKEREGLVVKMVNSLLLQFVFRKLWLKRTRERSMLSQIYLRRSAVLYSRYFSMWLARMIDNEAASSVRDKVIICHVFDVMKLRNNELKFQRKGNQLKVRKFLLQWRERTTHELLLGKHLQKNLLGVWLHEWQRKYHSFNDLSYITVKCRDSFLLKHYYNQWAQKSMEVLEMKRKSGWFAKLHVISKVKGVLKRCEKLNATLEAFVVHKSRRQEEKYMSVWISSMRIQMRLKQEIMLDQYLIVGNMSLIKSCFSQWAKRYRYFYDDCNKVAKRQNAQTIIASVLRRALSKRTVYDNWRIVSMELDNQSKLSSYFGSFKLKYELVSALNEQLGRVLAEKELSMLINCLNMWTMKQLKSSRNRETVELFRNRWNRASLRAILLLWKEKCDSIKADPPAFSDERFTSGSEPNDRSLVTPTRMKKSGRITIPGSEVIKRNRMEAMKNHYRRARKAIPSPIKFSDNLDSVTKRRLETNSETMEDRATPPPPKMNLEKINKNLASKKSMINFRSIPEAKLSPAPSSRVSEIPVVDRSLLSKHNRDLDRSPTVR
ncbi:LADA_0D10396g1_1 [Lachancea dasiensis]|uniref:LADA_0D10396g1_1 n=1 Tax=Lachancea dasiensis TaxID=1072105 RepID=A0A1G4J835_9SACH|nr:LADA_0D10396g1_1 [Lachancea dasiensis]